MGFSRTEAALAVLSLGIGMACTDPTGPLGQEPLPDVTEWVTGAAAAALDADGHFDLPRSPWTGGLEIAPEYADSVAQAYVRTFVTNPDAVGDLGAELNDDRGAPIDWSRVESAPRGPYWAYTPYRYDDANLPANARNLLGPQYLVPLQEDETQVAVVIVPARATDVGINEDGLLELPVGGVPGLEVDATPCESPYRIPLSPEEAVESVGTRSPALIAEIPRYIGPGIEVLTSYGRWELALDREVELRDPVGTPVWSDTVYVGLEARLSNGRPVMFIQWYVPTEPQPGPLQITFTYRNASGDLDATVVSTTVDEQTPLAFVRVYPP